MSREKSIEQYNYPDYEYQQPLTRRGVFRLDSQKINKIRANTGLLELSIAQLCKIIELYDLGINDYERIANEAETSEMTVKSIFVLFTED